MYFKCSAKMFTESDITRTEHFLRHSWIICLQILHSITRAPDYQLW